VVGPDRVVVGDRGPLRDDRLAGGALRGVPLVELGASLLRATQVKYSDAPVG
jgi:hypothetical protein